MEAYISSADYAQAPWYSMNLTTARCLKLILLGHFLFGLVFCVKSLVAQVSRPEAFLCGVCTFSPCTPASPNLKNMPVRQIGKSKVAIGVSVSRVFLALFLWPCDELPTCARCNPAFTSTVDGWDGLQQPLRPWVQEKQS